MLTAMAFANAASARGSGYRPGLSLVQNAGADRLLPRLLFALVFTSVIATLPQVLSLWDGAKLQESDRGLRLLREGMLGVTVVWLLFQPDYRALLWRPAVAGIVGLLMVYAAFETLHALARDLPLVVPLSGLRVFQYLPLLFAGMMCARRPQGRETFDAFAGYLRVFVVLQGLIALNQAFNSPPVYGVSFLGGGRPWGTFTGPNPFGAALAACALVFAYSTRHDRGRWVFLSSAVAVLSGSRTAVIGVLLIVTYLGYRRLPPLGRWGALMAGPFLLPAALWLASSDVVSGRNIEGEGRIEGWLHHLHNLQNGWDLAFGWGLGLGSNTVTMLYGKDAFPGQFIADGLYMFLLSGYGLVGVLAYLGLVIYSWARSRHPDRLLLFSYVLLAGVAFNAWEVFPQNALLMFLWGWVLGFPPREPAHPAPQWNGHGTRCPGPV